MCLQSDIQLTYFNFKGLAESARFILHYSDVDFQDERIDFVNDWLDIKKNQPFHQLPLLRAEGRLLTQSIAIWRYVATRYGLVADTVMERAYQDSVVYHISDMYEKLKVEQNAGKLAEYEKEVMPFYLGRFEDMIQEHGNFCGEQVSWPEIVFASIVDVFESSGRLNRPILDQYPKLLALKNRIVSKPSLRKYLNSRKQTEW